MRYAMKDVVLGKMSVRGATAFDNSRAVAHPHVVEIRTPSASLTVAARNTQEQKWWIEAINAAGQCLLVIDLRRRPDLLR